MVSCTCYFYEMGLYFKPHESGVTVRNPSYSSVFIFLSFVTTQNKKERVGERKCRTDWQTIYVQTTGCGVTLFTIVLTDSSICDRTTL